MHSSSCRHYQYSQYSCKLSIVFEIFTAKNLKFYLRLAVSEGPLLTNFGPHTIVSNERGERPLHSRCPPYQSKLNSLASVFWRLKLPPTLVYKTHPKPLLVLIDLFDTHISRPQLQLHISSFESKQNSSES